MTIPEHRCHYLFTLHRFPFGQRIIVQNHGFISHNNRHQVTFSITPICLTSWEHAFRSLRCKIERSLGTHPALTLFICRFARRILSTEVFQNPAAFSLVFSLQLLKTSSSTNLTQSSVSSSTGRPERDSSSMDSRPKRNCLLHSFTVEKYPRTRHLT